MQVDSARVLGPAEGAAGFLGSIGVRFMIDGAQTGGGFSLVEHPMSARALAAPLHKPRGFQTARVFPYLSVTYAF